MINLTQVKRTKIIKIRTTDREYLALKQLSQKHRLAEWMREHCLGAIVPKKNPLPNVDPALLRQIAGIGNNLNQIARAMNSHEWRPVNIIEVISALSSMQRELGTLQFIHTLPDSKP